MSRKLIGTRERLRKTRDELNERLARIRRDLHRGEGPLPADFSDQATLRENDEVLERLEESTAGELHQVQHALDHLERGLYGHCEHCGETIGAGRLAAVPEATTCSHCATAKAA